MGELGEILRRAREAKGLSLAQVEEVTRIRSAYLQALEEEDYQRLPPPVYVKGFLKNYALFLDLNPQQVLALYHEPEAAKLAIPGPTILDEPLEPFSPQRLWPVVAVLLVIGLAVAGWWGYQRYYARVPSIWPFTRATATPTLTPVPPTATATPTQTLTPTPTWTASPTATPTTAAVLEVRIEVVSQRAWLLVQADGQRVFAGILEPGAINTWTARERIVLRSGNAGAVRVTVNGQALGPLGEFGQVVEKEWTMPGVPTRTPSPTATP